MHKKVKVTQLMFLKLGACLCVNCKCWNQKHTWQLDINQSDKKRTDALLADRKQYKQQNNQSDQMNENGVSVFWVFGTINTFDSIYRAVLLTCKMIQFNIKNTIWHVYDYAIRLNERYLKRECRLCKNTLGLKGLLVKITTQMSN